MSRGMSEGRAESRRAGHGGREAAAGRAGRRPLADREGRAAG